MDKVNSVEPNSITANVVSGKQRKDPSKQWEGLAVNAIVDQVKYSGIIFPKREFPQGTPVMFNTI